MYSSMISLRFGIRLVGSDIGSGLRSSRVLGNEMIKISVKKLRRLRVYEKGGSSVFKIFLFISQLVYFFPTLNDATTLP